MKYGIGGTDVDYIKFESDEVYHGDETHGLLPEVRTEYDLKTEMDLIGEEANFLQGKIDMIPVLAEKYVTAIGSLQDRTFKTEDDMIDYQKEVNTNFKDLKDALTNCYEGSGMEFNFNEDVYDPDTGEALPTDLLRKSESDSGELVFKVETDSIAGGIFSKMWHYVKKFFKWIWDKIKALFGKVIDVFKGGGKVLERLKGEIEQLGHELNENVNKYVPELSYYLAVMSEDDRSSYTNNVTEAIESSSGGLEDWIKNIKDAMDDALSKYGKKTGELNKAMTAIVNERFGSRYLKPNNVTSKAESRELRFGKPNALTFSKTLETGTYFNVGVSGRNAICIHTKRGLAFDVIKIAVIESNKEINNLRPEDLKQKLISICDMGIEFLGQYGKKKFKEMNDDVSEKEKTLLEAIKTTENGVYDAFKEIEDKGTRTEIEKSVKVLLKEMTDNTMKCAKGTVSLTMSLGQQANSMISAVKSGMKRFN